MCPVCFASSREQIFRPRPHASELSPCAVLRCVVQLSILGFVLVPIFTFNRWELNLAYACLMLAVGAYEAVSRPAYSYTVSDCIPGADPRPRQVSDQIAQLVCSRST